MTVERSTISGNSATGEGGGVYNFGDMRVERSTVSGNTADRGGGLYNFTGDLTIANSTISGNTATSEGGGVANGNRTMDILFSTITDNTAPFGAGVWTLDDSFTFTNIGGSVVAANEGPDVEPGSPPRLTGIVSLGFNVVGTGDATDRFTASGDVTGVADPGLGVLADNGGPTWTHEARCGSPALDRVTTPGSTWDEASDQRGAVRPFGAAKDMGAFERQSGCRGPVAVLVTGNAVRLPAPDVPYVSLLEGMGFEVVLVDDNAFDLVAAVLSDDPDVVVVSSSVKPTLVGTKLRDIAVPVVLSEGVLFDEFEMSERGDNGERVAWAIGVVLDPVAGPVGPVPVFTRNTRARSPAPYRRTPPTVTTGCYLAGATSSHTSACVSSRARWRCQQPDSSNR